MSQAYSRLTLDSFSRLLLETEDLDPVYVALHRLRPAMPNEQLARWLVAYWCLYHVGAACYLAEFDPLSPKRTFWKLLCVAAKNQQPSPLGGRWPRGRERRHWRGTTALNAAMTLGSRYDEPLDFVAYLLSEDRLTAKGVIQRAKEHPSFGDWIGFKVADMLERVWGPPIDFTAAEVFVFDTPAKAAHMLWVLQPTPIGEPLSFACDWLAERLGEFKAPPRYDRSLGLQEFETMLCKWKSHMGGHYPLFNDIRELRHAAAEWRHVSPLARAFHDALPELPR